MIYECIIRLFKLELIEILFTNKKYMTTFVMVFYRNTVGLKLNWKTCIGILFYKVLIKTYL